MMLKGVKSEKNQKKKKQKNKQTTKHQFCYSPILTTPKTNAPKTHRAPRATELGRRDIEHGLTLC